MSDELPKPDQNEEEQENKIVNEESLHDNVTFRSLVSSFKFFFLRKILTKNYIKGSGERIM